MGMWSQETNIYFNPADILLINETNWTDPISLDQSSRTGTGYCQITGPTAA